MTELADGLEQGFQTGSISAQLDQAAAELRRLHEVNAELVEALKNIASANPSRWDEEVRDQFQEWAQNRARYAIAKATGEQQ